MLESYIQTGITRWAKTKGFMVMRMRSGDKAGYPDLILLKNGVTRFIEVKQKGEKPTPIQEKVHRQLRAQGFQVTVLDFIPRDKNFSL